MTLNEFLKANPHWAELHVIIQEDGNLLVIKGPAEHKTKNKMAPAETKMFAAPTGM